MQVSCWRSRFCRGSLTVGYRQLHLLTDAFVSTIC
jgi:hypothetical protein